MRFYATKLRIERAALLILLLNMIETGALAEDYMSISQMLVVRKCLETAPKKSADCLPPHIALVQSDAVLSRAAERGNLHARPSLVNNDVVSKIREGLQVFPSGGVVAPKANILTIAYHGSDSLDCPLVLQNVISAYMDAVVESFGRVDMPVRRLVEDAMTKHRQLSTIEGDSKAAQQTRIERLQRISGILKKWLQNATQLNRFSAYEIRCLETRAYRSAAQAVIEIRPNPLPLAVASDPAPGFDDNLETHFVLLRTIEVVKLMARKTHLDRLPSYLGSADHVADLLTNLKVLREGPNQLGVSLTAKHGSDSEKVLSNLVPAYQELLAQWYSRVDTEAIKSVTALSEAIDTELRATRGETSASTSERPTRDELPGEQASTEVAKVLHEFDQTIEQLTKCKPGDSSNQYTVQIVSKPGIGFHVDKRQIELFDRNASRSR